MYLKPYSILEKIEDENKIVIWSQLPFWLYINQPTVELLDYINGISIIDLVSVVRHKYDIEPDIDELMSLINILHDACALSYEGQNNELDIKEPKDFFIQYLTFNITNACNLYCSHCYIDASNLKKQYMTFEDAKKIIDKISPYMIESCRINVSGGEALMNKDVYEILEYFAYKGYDRINLVSNATLITKDIAIRLKRISNLKIQVSLDGATKNTHEKIRGKNTYEKTIDGIKCLVEEGHKVHLSPMITHDFFAEIEQYFYLAKELGIKAVFLQPVICIGRAKENKLERVNDAVVFKKVVEMYEDDPDLINYIPGTLEAMYISNIKLLNRMINCGTGTGTLAIQPNGDCYPCANTIHSTMNCGNILDNDFLNIWKESPILKDLRKIHINKNLDKQCAECTVRHFCGGGCRGQALANTGDIYALSCSCNFEREQLIEMLWVAATKPQMFDSEVLRQNELNREREAQILAKISLLRDSIIDY